MPVNRQVTLAARPTGEPTQADFALVESDVPPPAEGEVVVRTLWLSLDPYQRGRMNEGRSYARHVDLGEVMTAQAVGEVVESRSSRFRPGDVVLGPFGWQEYAVAPERHLRCVDASVAPISTALHVLGMTGLTAYFGLFDICRPVPGDTVVVSAASGAVGQIVGQLARFAGCRTVGIAGSPEKVARQLVDLWDEFRFDEFLLICHYGGTRRWQAMKTQELFWKKVRPMLDAASVKASKKTVVAAA